LHPLGARWIQEHFLTHGEQETKSYYGILNPINLYVGYHNEHHDFPSVPWNNLPKIKKVADDYYSSLGYHTSYTRLLLQFLFDKKLSVYSRMARANRGGRVVDKKKMAELVE
jgi:sphingolipid 4-desaturase/C4-monooxygenase